METKIALCICLFFRDISYTPLKSLGNNPHQIFTNLENLLVKHSSIARPENWGEIFKLRRLFEVSGVDWSRLCGQCNITRRKGVNTTVSQCSNCSEVNMFYSKGNTFDKDRGHICLLPLKQGIYKSPPWYLEPGFTLQCVCDSKDCVTKLPLHPGALRTLRLQQALNFLYPLSSLALSLNLIVVSVISSFKQLRKSPTLFLILNMAICDFLMALFCISTAIFNVFPDNDEEVLAFTHTGSFPDLRSFILMCSYVTFVFSVTQLTSVLTSLFLSVEKYLCIVYCMKPDIRMTRKIAIICVSVTWLAAAVYNICVSIFLYDEVRTKILKGDTLLCSATSHSIGPIPVSQFLGFTYIFIFLFTIPLYVSMYLVVRKSSSQMGIKREGSLARKLALLVVTNLTFSAIPLSQLPFLGSMLSFSDLKDEGVSTYVVWLPFFLLSLNSFLNPFLFAFRHHLVKTHLRQIFRRTTQCLRKRHGEIAAARHRNVPLHSTSTKESKDTPL